MLADNTTLRIVAAFIRHSGELRPDMSQVEHYLRTEEGAAFSKRAASRLRTWQRAQQAGRTETEYCDNCWAVDIAQPGENELALSACTDCYKTVCEFCHFHPSGDHSEVCLCKECTATHQDAHWPTAQQSDAPANPNNHHRTAEVGEGAIESMSGSIYPTLQAFYAADETRRRSPEAGYGVQWRLNGYQHPWRVAYVQLTGEIYAVHQDRANIEGAANSHGPVIVIARVPPDHQDVDVRRDPYYATLDRILSGWAERCGLPNSLVWIRLALSDYPPQAGDAHSSG